MLIRDFPMTIGIQIVYILLPICPLQLECPILSYICHYSMILMDLFHIVCYCNAHFRNGPPVAIITS